MYVPFNSLPDDSRVWIYLADRKFTTEEIATISEALTAFNKKWTVHGTPLRSSFDIGFSQVIILAADEKSTGVSGCSIDDSVRTMKELGKVLGTDFFDRTLVAFKKDRDLVTIHLPELKKKFQDGVWDNKSLVANPLVHTKGDWEQSAFVAAEITWLKRYLPRESIAN
jgi:hypothetical protein